MEDARYSEIKETMLGEVTDKDDISKIKKLNTKIGKCYSSRIARQFTK